MQQKEGVERERESPCQIHLIKIYTYIYIFINRGFHGKEGAFIYYLFNKNLCDCI